MEKRKIMRLGKSSLVISIPKSWASKYKLDSSNHVILIPQRDGSLAVYPVKEFSDEPSEQDIMIDPKDEPGILERRLIAAYLNNFGIIRIRSRGVFTPEQQSLVRKRVRMLTGLQIIDASTNEIVIQSLMKLNQLDLPKSMRLAHRITSTMLVDALSALQIRDVELAKTVIGLDEDVNQFYFLVFKQLRAALLDPRFMNELSIDSMDCLTYLMFIQRIENVADHAKGIAESVISLGNEECPKDLLNLALKTGNHVHRIYVMAAEAMLIGDDKAANHVINEIDHFVPMRQQAEELMEQHLVTLCEQMLPQLTPETCALFGPHQKAMFCLENIFESFGKILEHASAIAEIAIDRALEHGSRWPAKEDAKQTTKKTKKSVKSTA
ncbi:MAG: PhoU domain-containing protein [Candidatus Thorarchaeota archaeon]